MIATYTAEKLILDRANLKFRLSGRLFAYKIIVEPGSVSLTNFEFSDEFNKAIESKQVAQQTAEKQTYVLQQAAMEAETAVTTAKGKPKQTGLRHLRLAASAALKC